MTEGPAQWRPDPSGRHEHRYWDGDRWTSHVADHGVPAEDPWVDPEPVEDVDEVLEPEGEPEPAILEWRPPVLAREPDPEPEPEPDAEPEPEPEPEPQPAPTVVAPVVTTPAAPTPPALTAPAPTTAEPAAATWAATQVEGARPSPTQVRRRRIIAVAVAAVALVGVFLAVRAGDDDEPQPRDATRILEDGVDPTATTGSTTPTDEPTDATDGTDGSTNATMPDGTPINITPEIRAQLVAGFKEGIGLTQEQAECTADGVIAALEAGELQGDSGMEAILPYARACGFEGDAG